MLKKDADTGASDVALDPSNPNVVFAGLWQARRRPWEMTSGGPGSVHGPFTHDGNAPRTRGLRRPRESEFYLSPGQEKGWWRRRELNPRPEA